MPATIEAAKAGATTGEWSETLREVFGAYRGPTGVDGRRPAATPSCSPRRASRVDEVSEQIGHRIKILVAKPGLDGHSNGAEQIAVRATRRRHGGRLPGHPPDPRGDRRLGASGGRRRRRPLDPLRLPPRAGPARRRADARGRASSVPVVVGGIIPPADAAKLTERGVARVYTPKDFDLNRIMGEIADLVGERATSEAPQPA